MTQSLPLGVPKLTEGASQTWTIYLPLRRVRLVGFQGRRGRTLRRRRRVDGITAVEPAPAGVAMVISYKDYGVNNVRTTPTMITRRSLPPPGERLGGVISSPSTATTTATTTTTRRRRRRRRRRGRTFPNRLNQSVKSSSGTGRGGWGGGRLPRRPPGTGTGTGTTVKGSSSPPPPPRGMVISPRT